MGENMKGKVLRAFKFANAAHGAKKRDPRKSLKPDGPPLPYMTHPLTVYMILKALGQDEDVLCAALLHDVVEDEGITIQDIQEEFGKKVAEIIGEVSKDSGRNINIKTREGLMVKLADMLHNISDSNSPEYVQKKIGFLNGKAVLELYHASTGHK